MSQRRKRPVWAGVLIGVVPVFALGSLLHFTYAWSGEWWLAAVFAAVNESTWEHLKIAFWPGLLYAVARSFFSRHPATASWSAHGYGLITVSVLIVLLFDGYTAMLGRNFLAADISIFFVGIYVGQVVSVISVSFLGRMLALRWMGLGLLAIQISAFSCFTFWPPQRPLFEDPRNGRFGIPAYVRRELHAGFIRWNFDGPLHRVNALLH